MTELVMLVDTDGNPYNAGGGGGGGSGGASAAEIAAALTTTNANMEASLQSLASDSTTRTATIIGGKQLIGGASDKWRDSFEALDATKWDYTSAMSPNDAALLGGDTTASGFVELCLAATAKSTASEVKGLRSFSPPYRLGFGASMSQRQYGELTIVSVAEVDETGARVIAAGETEGFFGPNLTINKISVTSNVAVVTFSTAHNLKYDDLVVISGAPDNRMNVQARVTQIRSKYAITVSMTYTNGNYALAATMNKIMVSKGSANCAGVVYMDATSANAVYFSRGQGSPEFMSVQSGFGTGYTDAVIPTAQPYAINLQPRFMTEVVGTMDLQRWIASGIDSASAGLFFKRTQAVPDPSKTYAMFMDVVALPNRAVPLEIASIVKTGTTTATVTTVNPHGLVTGAYVYGYGARDQTTLPNLTAPTAITVTGANTFTVIWGTAVTQTYYGGMIVPNNGGYSVPGALNTAVMGTSWYNGRLYCGMYITTPLLMGDVVRLIGVKDTAGTARANTSGRFRVVAINPNVQEAGIATGATTTTASGVIGLTETGAVPFGGYLTGTGFAANTVVTAVSANVSVTSSVAVTTGGTQLQDIALTGVALEPLDFAAPANDQPLVNISAGAVYRETTLRMNFARCLDYTRTPVEITGAHYTGDTQQALPIQAPSTLNVSASGTVTASQGTAAAIGTEGAGAWAVRGIPSRTTDAASAAITTTTTSAAISLLNNTGSVQVNFDVSAVSGTLPRMIGRVQGSFDNGVNFVNVYDVGVMTTSTAKNNDTPCMPAEFTHLRYSRIVTGTTPSFTNSVNRSNRPGEDVKRNRRLIDLVMALTATTASTEWLYSNGCVKGQITCTPLTGATTAPALKAQVCHGDPAVAANWFDVVNGTLTTSATLTTASAIFDLPHARFLRLVPTLAGVATPASTGYELCLTAWE